MKSRIFNSPVGNLLIREDEGSIVEVLFNDSESGNESEIFASKKAALSPGPSSRFITDDCEILGKCVAELEMYFAGKLKEFTVPLKLIGTDFRKKCWQALRTIPYGETISYKELAIKVGNPKACRAVGGANHHNPIVIIVPCHRVIGSGGSLTGFGGGLDKKQFLLDHEKKHK